MRKRWLALLLVMLLPLTALGEGYIPQADESADSMVSLSGEELLERMAEDDTDASAFAVLPEDIETTDRDVFTLLLIGSDAYTDKTRGRSDTTMLVQADADSKTIRVVSFLRDTYVQIPGKGSNRLNASYSWGGEQLLCRTLESNFGVTADAYLAVNFERLVQVIDGIGGIEVEVSERERVQVNSILRFYNEKIGAPVEDELLTESGTVHLTGKQALCFSRIRKIDGDTQRTARQRKVIEAAFHKVMSLDMASITALVLANMDAFQTDLTPADALRLIPLAIRCKHATFETLTIPQQGTYSTRMTDGMWVIVPNLKQNKALLQEFLHLKEE
ncbi:MAG: LCP family protein [Aristaeellaceae bacterium]